MNAQLFKCEHCGLPFSYALWDNRHGAMCPTCLRPVESFPLGVQTRGQRRLRRIGLRDGWVCHLCGRKVSPNGRGPATPTLDHIVPKKPWGR